MLWRMAFPVLTLIFGVLVGITLGNQFAQGDMELIRNQSQITSNKLSLSEAELFQARAAHKADNEQYEQAIAQLQNRLRDADGQNGQAFAAIDSLRGQVATCRNDTSVALTEIERLRGEVDNLNQICSNSSQ